MSNCCSIVTSYNTAVTLSRYNTRYIALDLGPPPREYGWPFILCGVVLRSPAMVLFRHVDRNPPMQFELPPPTITIYTQKGIARSSGPGSLSGAILDRAVVA